MSKKVILPGIVLGPFIIVAALVAGHFKTMEKQGLENIQKEFAQEQEQQQESLKEIRKQKKEQQEQDTVPDAADYKHDKNDFLRSDREIFTTNGIKHSVKLDQIVGGGPEQDGIPSIDDPKFISANDAQDFLNDTDVGIAFKLNGVNRFYPFKILVFHEIVNDTIDGERVLITYCPLCLSGIVFDPVVNGEHVEFGTSGKLWNSNLVMYDRKTNSLWSQILGEAIQGEATGTQLRVLPFDQMRFGEWKNKYPDGDVLSKDTGAIRFYGRDPYGDYYSTPGTYFPIAVQDKRLADKTYILGVVIDGKSKAYVPESIKQQGTIIDEFNGNTIVAQYEKDLDVVRMYIKNDSGNLERLNPMPSFWFAWSAAHQETELYK